MSQILPNDVANRYILYIVWYPISTIHIKNNWSEIYFNS